MKDIKNYITESAVFDSQAFFQQMDKLAENVRKALKENSKITSLEKRQQRSIEMFLVAMIEKVKAMCGQALAYQIDIPAQPEAEPWSKASLLEFLHTLQSLINKFPDDKD